MPMILLTPGPLTTRISTRQAMLSDWGSRDSAFAALTANLRDRLVQIVHGEETHAAVPIQGSGTFVVEAALQTLVGADDKLLVLANGVYGERMASIAQRLGRRVEIRRWPVSSPVDAQEVKAALLRDATITHVGLVHCETTTGLLNPLEQVAQVVAEENRHLILDAMSSFGAIDIDVRKPPISAVLASSNKCLESVPGIAFAIVDKESLSRSSANSSSTSLDLHLQWQEFERSGQWRFTPPVQVVAATVEALDALDHEGGPKARLARYRDNFSTLLTGMKALGFRLYLDESVQSPIIATFRYPEFWTAGDGVFRFDDFYAAVARGGFLLYPGKLTEDKTFRIGCIGNVNKSDFEELLRVVADVLGTPDAR
ncbi:MAG: 2-aminoethylphosphonate--pyruvate transaminase [Alphaproteobacteria bacterium]|nr:2-aminoethylphosphonate--pyruvate transaminase [Alphaproteobacteria bacterium]